MGASVKKCSDDGHTPLLLAADEGHSEMCSLLLAYGSNVEEESPPTKFTALHKAASKGHFEILKTLLSCGANVDSLEHRGSTGLHIASQAGHLTCVLSLIQAGASMALTREDGIHPIHLAAGANMAAVVRILLQHGCDKELSCENEKTPLMRAAQNGADETVRELLRWGASPNKVARARLYFDPCKIGTGLNALGFAILSKCHSTISLLASMTDTGLEGLLYLLCSEQMEVTQHLEELIKRLSGTDKGAAMAGLRYASIFGHTHLVKLLSQGRELPELFIQQLLEEAVRSDNHETCAAILPLLKGKMPRPE